MPTEYRVISDWLCFTAGHKAKKIERHPNDLSVEGWEFVALDSVSVCWGSILGSI